MAQNLVKDAFWESLFRTFSDLENSKFSLIFLEKRSKFCQSQGLDFFEFAQQFS
jgi:hypothetical protein